jgi:plasmid stabilization system protein ParE
MAAEYRGSSYVRSPRVPYLIVYRIDLNGLDELVILRVYHGAQDRSHGGH